MHASVVRTMLLGGVTLGAALSLGHAQRPLPLDPLTERERAIADSVVRADPRVRDVLGSRDAQLVQIEFIAAKTGRDAAAEPDVPARRHAHVLFYVPAANAGVSVLVDLERAQVVDVVRSPGDGVPISTPEVERAARLALANPAVVRLFGERLPAFRLERGQAGTDTAATRIDAIRTLGVPGDPCYRRRCVVLFFRVDNRYVHMNRVLVDLGSNRVIVRQGER